VDADVDEEEVALLLDSFWMVSADWKHSLLGRCRCRDRSNAVA